MYATIVKENYIQDKEILESMMLRETWVTVESKVD